MARWQKMRQFKKGFITRRQKDKLLRRWVEKANKVLFLQGLYSRVEVKSRSVAILPKSDWLELPEVIELKRRDEK